MIEQEFKKYYEAEIENLNKVLNEIKKIREFRPKELDNIKIAASGTFLHNFYNGIENVLKRALLAKGIKIKNGASWHKEVLIQAKNLNIITEELHMKLLPYLTFRHYFVHGYSFKLVPSEVMVLLKDAEATFCEFRGVIEKTFNLTKY